MPYTTPTTRVTNDIITAAQWNADLVENIKWLPRGVLYTAGSPTSTSAIMLGGTTAETSSTLGTSAITTEANRRYRISGYITYVTSGNQVVFKLRRGTTTAGSLLQLVYCDKQTNGRITMYFDAFDTPGAGSTQWTLFGTVDTGGWDVYHPSGLVVEDAGGV